MSAERPSDQLINKLQDIKNNPQDHAHDYNGMFECCLHDGALNSELLDAHPKTKE